MNEIPPIPQDPAALRDWVASLSPEDLAAITGKIMDGSLLGGLGLAGRLRPGNPPIDLPPPPEEPSLLTLTIELLGSKPRIWRRLALPGDLRLDAVHTLFQGAMGWTDSHLHRFQPGPSQRHQPPYFITEFDEEEGDTGTREDHVRLDQVLRKRGDQLIYLYDFGDGWEHRVTLESAVPLTPGNNEPSCLAGAKGCPPEDVGGIWSHNQIAAWLRAGMPANAVPEPFEDAEHALGWLPVDYDPDAFDPGETTAAMRLWASGENIITHGLPEGLADLVQLMPTAWWQAHAWMALLGPREPVELDDEVVRVAARPWLAMLDAIGPGVKLTAAGYLPPVVVKKIAQDAGIEDWWIGMANREDLTWPVAVLRSTAQQVGLLRKSRGTLTPTVRARALIENPRLLVGHVLKRMPLGKGFEADAGWLLMLGLAAGASKRDLEEGMALMLSDRGWGIKGSRGVSAEDARIGSRDTLNVLEWMTGQHRKVPPELLRPLALAALLGVAEQK